MLKIFSQPTLIMEGEKTQLSYRLINDGFSRCLPKVRRVVLANVNHDGPRRDPAAFTAAVFEFLSKR
jgi:pimeloyl-ACP methyl ester carboxylesterase